MPIENSYLVKIGIQLLLTYRKQLFHYTGCSRLKLLILNLFYLAELQISPALALAGHLFRPPASPSR